MSDVYEVTYVWDGYDEFEPIKSAPRYRVAKSITKAFEAVQKFDGLTTVIKLESGEVIAVEGRAEVIGTYDPSIPSKVFRSDCDAK